MRSRALRPYGRPAIPPAKWNRVLDLKASGLSVKEIRGATELSQTKVYEILRSGVRKDESNPTDIETTKETS